MRNTNGINALEFIATPPIFASRILPIPGLPADGRVLSGRPTAPKFSGDFQIVRLDAPAKMLFNNQADWEYKSNFLVFPIVRSVAG